MNSRAGQKTPQLERQRRGCKQQEAGGGTEAGQRRHCGWLQAARKMAGRNPGTNVTASGCTVVETVGDEKRIREMRH
jgi:hypothetical protein